MGFFIGPACLYYTALLNFNLSTHLFYQQIINLIKLHLRHNLCKIFS